MNATSTVETLLSGDTSITPKGRFADLILPKKAGLVRRRRDYRVFCQRDMMGALPCPWSWFCMDASRTMLNRLLSKVLVS